MGADPATLFALTRKEREALLPGFIARLDSATERRAAVEDLEAWMKAWGVRPPLLDRVAALGTDADPQVRLATARALLAVNWQYGGDELRLLDAALDSGDPDLRETAIALTVGYELARATALPQIQELALRLLPIPTARKAALRLVRKRSDVAVDTLRPLLSDADDEVVEAALVMLWAHHKGPAVRDDVVRAARRLLDNRWYAGSATWVLVDDAMDRQDGAALLELAAHPSLWVREALAAELGRERPPEAIALGIPTLVALITGENASKAHGGTLFYGMKALLAIAERGGDVSRAIPAVQLLVDEDRYPDDGWASGRDFVVENDRHSESLGGDARRIIELHKQRG